MSSSTTREFKVYEIDLLGKFISTLFLAYQNRGLSIFVHESLLIMLGKYFRISIDERLPKSERMIDLKDDGTLRMSNPSVVSNFTGL